MTTALSVRNATKIFGAQVALDNVSIDVEPGEVRALVGQNGCGKSTLIKILAGFHAPEPGTEATVGGEPLPVREPGRQRGGRPPLRAPGPRPRRQPRRRRQHGDGPGLHHQPDQDDPVAQGAGPRARGPGGPGLRHQRQGSGRRPPDVRAHRRRHRPGDVRPRQPRQDAHPRRAHREPPQRRGAAAVPAGPPRRGLRRRGALRLPPLRRGLRDGRLRHGAARRQADHDPPGRGLTEEELIELVVGRKLEEHDKRDADAREHGVEILTLNGVSGGSDVQGMDLTVHRGEVVGIAGITGSGREAVAPVVFGGHRAVRRDHRRRQGPAAEPPGHLDRARHRPRAGRAARERLAARPDAAREHHARRSGSPHDAWASCGAGPSGPTCACGSTG